MLLSLMDVLVQDPLLFLRLAPIVLGVAGGGILVALTVHEFGHALVATLLGDITARAQGRVSLNPLRHLDPAGTLMILLVGFGWGKPVQFNPAYVRYGRRGVAMVAGAGPASNFTTAALLAVPARLGVVDIAPRFDLYIVRILESPLDIGLWVTAVVSAAFAFNILLGLFNLLPIFPLDGFNVAVGVLPGTMAYALLRTQQYGMGILLVIIAADMFFGIGLLSRVLTPAGDFLRRLLLGG